MKTKQEITVDQWLHELDRLSAASGDNDGFITVGEIGAQTTRDKDWVLKRLHLAKIANRLEVRQVMRQTITGSWHSVPGYRIQKEPVSK